MGRYLRGNDQPVQQQDEPRESAFARMVLARLGGSSVYIEKRKNLVELESV